MAVAASSIANLIPFTRGPDPRRANGRNIGASYIEWCNRLDVVSDEELDRIAASSAGPDNPSSRIIAAQDVRRARVEGFAKNGRALAHDSIERLLDRTHGKPTQRVEVEKRETKDPAALTVELLRMCAEHPELRAALGMEVGAAQAAAALPAASSSEEEAGQGEQSLT
ncbi:MAG: hypothetical protein ACYS7M_10705 [Planctomycetota bacterium]|jgi:hypothetical protein